MNLPPDWEITAMLLIGTVGCICALFAALGWAADWLADRLANKE